MPGPFRKRIASRGVGFESSAFHHMEFYCPRCNSEVDQDFYAPCEDVCVPELRLTVRAEARSVEDEDYEPKMNVAPNAVATKDD